MSKRRTFVKCLLLLFGAAVSIPQSLFGQTSPQDANTAPPVFKANARTVVIDVVVTGKDGRPVRNLQKRDFEVTEDGRPQTLVSFEEHTAADSFPKALPDLPANIFSNVPRVAPTHSVTILLLDALNTQIRDQSYVHAQILKYLKGLQPGHRMAVFALGTRLRFIQGFTDDPAALAGTLGMEGRAMPQTSPLLPSSGEAAAEQRAVAELSEHSASAASGLQQFLKEQTASRTDQRIQVTLQALQQLGRYLAGIPGRKNLVWFSGSFPLNLFPDPTRGDSFDNLHSYDEEVRRTNDILTAAQVAIYPIAADGLATDSLSDADHQMAGMHNAYEAQIQQTNTLRNDSNQRASSQATMDEIAKDTGGEAFYNTNGLNDALARVLDHGSSFYTLSYTPTNSAADGRNRRLKVKVAGGDYKLAYRRSTDRGRGVDLSDRRRGSGHRFAV